MLLVPVLFAAHHEAEHCRHCRQLRHRTGDCATDVETEFGSHRVDAFGLGSCDWASPSQVFLAYRAKLSASMIVDLPAPVSPMPTRLRSVKSMAAFLAGRTGVHETR